MSSEELKKYSQLLASMSVDHLSGKISDETYLANLKLIVNKLDAE